MSNKTTYYVSVQSGSILEEKGAAVFEFEIQATDQDLDRLERLFDHREKADDDSFTRAHVPFLEYHHDSENDAHDVALTEIYRELHRLGTPETKQHIESMHVL